MARMQFTAQNGAKFEDPAPQVLEETAFGILWDLNGGYARRNDRVISRFDGWRIIADAHMTKLVDPRGEVRGVSWGRYHRAIEYPNWTAYDAAEQAALCATLQKERQSLATRAYSAEEQVERLMATLKMIYDINKEGGPGSRRKVRNMILDMGISPCTDCENAVCSCGSSE